MVIGTRPRAGGSGRLGNGSGFVRSGALLALVFLACVAATLWRGLSVGAPVPANPHGDLKEECGLCHGADSWVPVKISPKFDHSKYGFALTGAHAQAPCASCHASLDFGRAAATCTECHEDVHTGEFGEDCAECHTFRSFNDRAQMEQMHQVARFPLFGAHAALDCESCHTAGGQGNLSFVNQSSECVECHLADLQSTTDPDHMAAGFSTDCDRCHGPGAWHSVAFDHGATRFPLTGAHRVLDCESCHIAGNYADTDPLCIACHQDDYDGTTEPNHPAAGYSQDCTACHSTISWSGADFDHRTTGFPLTGAHLPLPCLTCHGDGVYSGKSRECSACHQDDYDGTTDPSHLIAGFPLDCAACHTTTTWVGATFDHDGPYFYIYSGRHRSLWNDCTDCHTNPTNYVDFTCFTCHPHSDQAKTDEVHLGRAGYAYDSQACYTCHPTGNQ